jgi:hypothetical protein
VTPTDELWNDMTQFDTEVADGIWDGVTPPADAPAWWSDVALLVRAAKGPADTAELAAEDDIVARMAAVLRDAATGPTSDDAPDDGNDADHVTTAPARAGDSPDSLSDDTDSSDRSDDDTAPAPAEPAATPLRLVVVTGDTQLPAEASDDEAEAAANASDGVGAATPLRPAHAATRRRGEPRHQEPDEGPRHLKAPGPAANGIRLVRRALAVKAVATTTAVAIGITAAAAATGVVVTVVDPPKRDTPETTITTSVAPPGAVGDGAEEPGGGSGAGADYEPTPLEEMIDDSRVLSPLDLTCSIDFACAVRAAASPEGTTTTTSSVPGGSTTVPSGVPSSTTASTSEPTPTLPETTVTTTATPTTTPPVPTTEPTTSTTDTSLPQQEPAGLSALPAQAQGGRRNR